MKRVRHSISNVVLAFETCEAIRHLGIRPSTCHTRRTFQRAFAVVSILGQRRRCALATDVLLSG